MPEVLHRVDPASQVGLVVPQPLTGQVEDGEGRAGLGRQGLAEVVADGHLAGTAVERKRGGPRQCRWYLMMP